MAKEEKRVPDVISATSRQSKLSSPLVISTSISSNVTESHRNGWNYEDDGSVAMDVSFESLETSTDEEIAEEQLYAEDIYQYCLTLEKVYKPKPSYMSKQPDINHAMRSILIDWMVEVSEEMNLSDETLFIAVSLVDRFLSKMMVLRGKLQLVGSTAPFSPPSTRKSILPQSRISFISPMIATPSISFYAWSDCCFTCSDIALHLRRQATSSIT